MLRYLARIIVLPVALFAFEAHAQIQPCTDGAVTHGGETFACSEIDLLSRVSLEEMGLVPPPEGNGNGNDVWGWTDPLTDREYALMGLSDGIFFVDVTNPYFPVRLGKLPTATQPSLWRDMKTYADFMFVVSEAPGHGMQVFDLTHLRDLSHDPSRVFSADVTFTGPAGNTLGRAHNIAINEDSGYAYVVGARNQNGTYVCAGGLYMVDISNPLDPQFAGCFAQDGYTHDVQCVIYQGPDTQHQGSEICFASNENTVTIVDVTNKANPVMLSQAIYENTGYTHQGWLSEDHRYFFVDDEFDEMNFNQNTRTIVFNVEDLALPDYVGSHFYSTSASTHNLFVNGDYLFAANYKSGLRILRVGNFVATGFLPAIIEVGYFDTHPQANDTGFRGAWSNYPYFESGIVLISDIDRGLFVVQPRGLMPPVSSEPDPAAVMARVEVYPNPFSDRFTLDLRIEREQRVRIEVYDILGRRVASLFEDQIEAGRNHEMSFRLADQPGGVYVIRISGEDFTLTERVTRLR